MTARRRPLGTDSWGCLGDDLTSQAGGGFLGIESFLCPRGVGPDNDGRSSLLFDSGDPEGNHMEFQVDCSPTTTTPTPS